MTDNISITELYIKQSAINVLGHKHRWVPKKDHTERRDRQLTKAAKSSADLFEYFVFVPQLQCLAYHICHIGAMTRQATA